VLVFAATGRQAFGGPDSGAHALMLRATEDDPDLEGMPEALAELVGRCLAKRPEDRISLPEILATAEAATADAHADAWLPGDLMAELGRHAARLLDLEEPPPTQVDNPAAGRGGDSVHALPTMQGGRVPPPPPGTPTPVPMPPVATPTSTPMPPMPTPRMTVTTPPMPPVPGGLQPGGRRKSRVGPVLTVAAVAVLAIVLAVRLPDGGNENSANSGASGAGSSTEPPKASPADYKGKWTGNVREGDGDLYSIKVNYTGGKLSDQVATVEYPSLQCSGRWILTMDTGNSVQVREEITEESSPLNCVDEVDIILTPADDGSLRYKVTSVEDTGTLRRSN
jgi:hypothetical protein